MGKVNYHLMIKNNFEGFYFRRDNTIHTGDIVRIGGYRVVILSRSKTPPYIRLHAELVNEGEIIIEQFSR